VKNGVGVINVVNCYQLCIMVWQSIITWGCMQWV